MFGLILKHFFTPLSTLICSLTGGPDSGVRSELEGKEMRVEKELTFLRALICARCPAKKFNRLSHVMTIPGGSYDYCFTGARLKIREVRRPAQSHTADSGRLQAHFISHWLLAEI